MEFSSTKLYLMKHETGLFCGYHIILSGIYEALLIFWVCSGTIRRHSTLFIAALFITSIAIWDSDYWRDCLKLDFGRPSLKRFCSSGQLSIKRQGSRIVYPGFYLVPETFYCNCWVKPSTKIEQNVPLNYVSKPHRRPFFTRWRPLQQNCACYMSCERVSDPD